MRDIKKIEADLNKYSDPSSFHDMPIINLKFSENSLTIIFLLTGWMDNFNIVDNEKDNIILKVKYDGINIKSMNLDGFFEFRDSNVFNLRDDNGIVELSLKYDYIIEKFFSLKFTYEKYKWSFIGVISDDEYSNYVDLLFGDNSLVGIHEDKLPKWAVIE